MSTKNELSNLIKNSITKLNNEDVLSFSIWPKFVLKHDKTYVFLVSTPIMNINVTKMYFFELSIKYVSAKAQCKIVKTLMEENFFTEEELTIIKRARNHKSISHPKNCDIVTYRYATGFEALIGYLKLEKKVFVTKCDRAVVGK